MVLTQIDIDKVALQGRQNFILEAHQWLKIKVAEDFILQAQVPVGKRWTGDVLVMIDETDV